MIDRQKGQIIFECDECGDTFEPETGDFSGAWAAAKREGWRARDFAGVWTHSCGACRP